MLSKAAFIKWMTLLHHRFNRTPEEAVLALYFEHLRDLQDAQFVDAAQRVFNEDEYWPTPKRFRDLALGVSKVEAARDWASLLNACQRNDQQLNLSPAGLVALRAIGGWKAVAYAEGEFRLSSLRKAFLEAYGVDSSTLQLGAGGKDLEEAYGWQ